MITRLFHNAIRATDLDITRNFYTRVLGMIVDERRPPMDVPGFWLRAALPGSHDLIHVFGGKFAAAADGKIPTGGAAVHHLSYFCKGYELIQGRLADSGLSWRGQVVPALGLWQIFVHDPNGILLELTFDAAAEGIPTPVIPEACRYDGVLDWFNPSQYRAFARPQL